MPSCKLRNISTTTREAYMTPDGNVAIEHNFSSIWMVMPVGRRAFAVRGKAAAQEKACQMAASGEFGGIRPRRRKRRKSRR